MEIKRSRKIHLVVEEEPKRKPSKILVIEPEPEDSFYRKIIAEKERARELENTKEREMRIGREISLKNRLMDQREKRLLKEAKYKDYYSPIKVPNSDEIIEFKSVPEPDLTYEKMKEALEKFKVTNFVVAKGSLIDKSRMIFEYDLENIPSFKLEASDRLRKKEKQAKAEALLENARRTPGNFWVTGDGRRIPIAEMTDKHLVNTISYVFKKVDLYPSEVIQEAYQRLVGQKPWMPDAMYENRLTDFENDRFCQDVFKRFPKLQALIREAATRGLSLVKGDGQYQ